MNSKLKINNMAAQKYICWFKEIGKEDIAQVGGKGANLGEMYNLGIPVPPGFVVTSSAYYYFIEENNLKEKIKEFLKIADKNDPASYEVASHKIKKLIMGAKIPKDLALEIMKAYLKLGYPKEVLVAVRSSATAEDLPTASFAGQQSTFLNVLGETNVLKKVHECWASLFEARAIFYREENDFEHLKVGLAVPVQKMVQSDVSGVMFTIDPITLEKNRILVEAVWGLGEMIVQGSATPDHYIVDKDNLEILSKHISDQTTMLVKIKGVNKEIKVPLNKRKKQKITDRQIIEVARIGKKLHQHYFFPQDCEWAVEDGKVYFVQTRPVTTIKETQRIEKEEEEVLSSQKIILTGSPASPGIASGPVKIIKTPREIGKIKDGEVLVTGMTTPDFVPAMKKASAIVTDKGGATSHAAIVSRELGVPCVVGTREATKILKDGRIITVNGKTGNIYEGGLVYGGKHKELTSSNGVSTVFTASKHQDFSSTKTATKIYVNLAEPELASEVAKRNVDGVGLLRAEFMLAEIGIHPKKMIEDRKQKVFINYLSTKLSIFCDQFQPRPVIYRATDFKTNEYRHLTGGKAYEPEEPNPMLGYRGAYRYLADPAVFALELEAIKKVRQKYKNLHLMIPFVHQPWELFEVKKRISTFGLFRSPSFKLYMMVEIPSNVILIEDFIKIGIDGVSIGSNDLTMLLLGVDRDNSDVSSIYDERDPAVLWALEKVIKTCHKYKITCSICGQAPSVYHELVDHLVEWGITSVSVNPDAIEVTREIVYKAENRLANKRRD